MVRSTISYSMKIRLIPVLVGLLCLSALPGEAAAQTRPRAAAPVNLSFLPPAERKPLPYVSLGGLMLIKARIGEQDVALILDNRAEDSTIDTALARRLGLTFTGARGRLGTPGGTIRKEGVAEVPILIPGQMRLRARLSAVDLHAFSRIVGRRIDGILGRDYFHALALRVNSDERLLDFAPSGSMRAAPDHLLVALHNDRPQLTVASGGRRALLTVDLGYNGSIRLGPRAWTRIAGTLDYRRAQATHLDGRLVEVRHGTLPDLSIGTVTRRRVAVSQGPVLPLDGDGTIGMGFLGLYNFVIDIGARQLWLGTRRED